MFNFFDNNQNPFMFMMNMMGSDGVSGEAASEETGSGFGMPFMPGMSMNNFTSEVPMQFMQQTFQMHMQMMQMMQTMMMMPMQMMQTMAGDMSPENLEKLQAVMDLLFDNTSDSQTKTEE